MKTQMQKWIIAFGLLASIGGAAAQGTTAFSYQGRLNSGANPASGIYDLRFAMPSPMARSKVTC